MNILEPRMPELALLRDLPPEVSLAQVEQWVALPWVLLKFLTYFQVLVPKAQCVPMVRCNRLEM